MDRPITGSTGFMKVSLGNILTLIGMTVGFVGLIFNSSLTAGKYQEKFDNSEKRLGSIEAGINRLGDKVEGEQESMVDINAELKVIKETDERRDKRFELDETRISALESFSKTLDTNQQLINQQIQFLSHLPASRR